MEQVHTWDRVGLAEDNKETATCGSEESHEDRRKDWQLPSCESFALLSRHIL